MAEALCQIQPKLAAELNSKSKRRGKVVIPHPLLKGNKGKDDTPHFNIPNKRSKLGSMPINFPTSKELAMVDEEYLKEHCNLGHRAKTIVGLVRSIESGKLKLDEFDHQPSHEEISMQLFKIKGIGPFTSANVLMCLGFYHQIPVDSETVRLVRKVSLIIYVLYLPSFPVCMHGASTYQTKVKVYLHTLLLYKNFKVNFCNKNFGRGLSINVVPPMCTYEGKLRAFLFYNIILPCACACIYIFIF